MFGFNLFTSPKQENASSEPTWNANTLTMEQPSAPAAPSTENVVSEQPRVEDKMQLRGGGEKGDVCCGVCAGLACFECFECCC